MTDLSIATSLRLQLEYLPVAALRANELNPKMHPDRQINALARGMSEMGFVSPIIVDQDNRIVAGHGRSLRQRSWG